MAAPVKDREAIISKYEAMVDMKPRWLEHIENLLVAIEMYRIEEEKAVRRLADVLNAYGIDVTIDEIKIADMKELKKKVQKEAVL